MVRIPTGVTAAVQLDHDYLSVLVVVDPDLVLIQMAGKDPARPPGQLQLFQHTLVLAQGIEGAVRSIPVGKDQMVLIHLQPGHLQLLRHDELPQIGLALQVVHKERLFAVQPLHPGGQPVADLEAAEGQIIARTVRHLEPRILLRVPAQQTPGLHRGVVPQQEAVVPSQVRGRRPGVLRQRAHLPRLVVIAADRRPRPGLHAPEDLSAGADHAAHLRGGGPRIFRQDDPLPCLQVLPDDPALPGPLGARNGAFHPIVQDGPAALRAAAHCQAAHLLPLIQVGGQLQQVPVGPVGVIGHGSRLHGESFPAPRSVPCGDRRGGLVRRVQPDRRGRSAAGGQQQGA